MKEATTRVRARGRRNEPDKPASPDELPAAVSLPGLASAPPRRMSRRSRWAMVSGVVLVVLALAVVVPSIRWRLEVLGLELTGRLPDIGLKDLLVLLRPGSGQPTLSRLLATRNPYAVIRVPPLSARERVEGASLYGEQCAGCHAPDGTGGTSAPALVGHTLTLARTPWAMYRTIRYGVAGTGMPPHPLSQRQLWELVAYVRSLNAPALAERLPAAVTAKLRAVDVPYPELAATTEAGDDWLTYSGSYSADRFSTLAEISTRNVSQLALRWMFPFPGNRWYIECSPLVSGGVMYATGPSGEVIALDALTGERLWEHDHRFRLIGGGEGPLGQSRGVALLGQRVFAATWDSTLSALAADTGKVLWERRVGPYPGTWISAAPLAYRDLVVVGVTGPTGDGRGYLVAYDARTGRERWRFMTIPGPGEAGHDTWAGDSWRTGGAGPWMTGSYDPVNDILYWGTGNPRPDFSAATREGDNLYADSVLALRGATGKLLWYFQFTPGDTHDWDSGQVPLIADRTVDGQTERRLLFVNRNGFYYVLDRMTGSFLRGVPFVKENWASALDAHGRPILAPVAASLQGQEVFPGARGGTNWWPPSYDPDLGLAFLPALEEGMTFFPTAQTLPTAESTLYTAVRAVDAYTGKLVWEQRSPERLDDPTISGFLSTRGGLVFGGDHGRFFALDARTGRTLWSVGTGGTMYAAPVSFAVSGEQFVSVVAGRTLLTFALPAGRIVEMGPRAELARRGGYYASLVRRQHRGLTNSHVGSQRSRASP